MAIVLEDVALSERAEREEAHDAEQRREARREHYAQMSHLRPVVDGRFEHRVEDQKRVVMTHERKCHDRERIGYAVKVFH